MKVGDKVRATVCFIFIYIIIYILLNMNDTEFTKLGDFEKWLNK